MWIHMNSYIWIAIWKHVNSRSVYTWAPETFVWQHHGNRTKLTLECLVNALIIPWNAIDFRLHVNCLTCADKQPPRVIVCVLNLSHHLTANSCQPSTPNGRRQNGGVLSAGYPGDIVSLFLRTKQNKFCSKIKELQQQLNSCSPTESNN